MDLCETVAVTMLNFLTILSSQDTLHMTKYTVHSYFLMIYGIYDIINLFWLFQIFRGIAT